MRTKNFFLTLLLAAMISVPAHLGAQVTIGSGNPPSEWSLLYLCTYYQQKALHNARMTTAERNLLVPPNAPNAPAGGLMIFNTDAMGNVGCLEFWNGAQWISLCEDRLPETFGQPPIPTAPICPGSTINLGTAFEIVNGVQTDLTAGVSYQWYTSTDGTAWTNVAGAAGTGLNLTTTQAMFSGNTSIHVRRTAAHTSTNRTHTVSGVISLHQPTPFPFVPITLPGKQITGIGLVEATWAPRNVCFTTKNITDFPTVADEHRGFAPYIGKPGMMFQWGRNTGHSSTEPRRTWTQGASNWDAAPAAWNTTVPTAPVWTNDPCPNGWRLPTELEGWILEGVPFANRAWVTAEQAGALGLGCQMGLIVGAGASLTSFDYTQQLFFPMAGWRESFAGMLTMEDEAAYWGNSRLHGDPNGVNSAAAVRISPFITAGGYDRIKNYGFLLRCVKINSVP